VFGNVVGVIVAPIVQYDQDQAAPALLTATSRITAASTLFRICPVAGTDPRSAGS
jgi:hypothetical protein